MSKSRDVLILQAYPEELRIASARELRGLVEFSHVASFWCRSKNDDASALRDQTTLDALVAYVEERGWSGRELICLVGGPAVSCQHYDLPQLKGAALRQAALLKLKQQLHFDVGEAVVALNVIANACGTPNNQIRVDATAIHRDVAAAVIEAAATAKLRLRTLTVAPSAYARLAASQLGNEPGCKAVLQVDEKSSILIILNGPTPFVTTEIPVGAADFTAALMRPIIAGENVIQLDEAAALALRNEIGIPPAQQEIVSLQITGERILPLVEPVLQKLSKHLMQWLSYAGTCNGGSRIKKVVLTGPGGGITGLAPSLASRLAVEVDSQRWLGDRAVLGEDAGAADLEGFAVAVAGVQSERELPDLIPAEVRRNQRIERTRRLVTMTGPVVAAAVLAFAVMINRIGTELEPGLRNSRAQLAVVQTLIDQRSKLASEREQTVRLANQIEEFAAASPAWTGVFKELSLLLPRELKAIEYTCRGQQHGMVLSVKAGVYAGGNNRSFDEIVAQSLVLLQRSVFFKRVEISANRSPQPEAPDASGVVTIELELAYPVQGARA